MKILFENKIKFFCTEKTKKNQNALISIQSTG